VDDEDKKLTKEENIRGFQGGYFKSFSRGGSKVKGSDCRGVPVPQMLINNGEKKKRKVQKNQF